MPLLGKGYVRYGVVVAGHDQLRCEAAEGALIEVASTGANEELNGRIHRKIWVGDPWGCGRRGLASPPTSCPLPLSAREVMAASTLQYLSTRAQAEREVTAHCTAGQGEGSLLPLVCLAVKDGHHSVP